MGSLLFHSKPLTLPLSFDPAFYFLLETIKLATFYSKLSSSLLFLNLKAVRDVQFAPFLSKTTRKMFFKQKLLGLKSEFGLADKSHGSSFRYKMNRREMKKAGEVLET